MKVLVIILICTATFRLTRFVVQDTFPPMHWVRELADRRAFHTSKAKHRIARFFDELLNCGWCASMWLGAGVTWGTDYFVRVPVPALVWLTSSAVAAILMDLQP